MVRFHTPRNITQTDTQEQVLIWTDLAGGDNEYCAILAAVNSTLQTVSYAALAHQTLSHPESGVAVSYTMLATSVVMFLGTLIGAAFATICALRELTSAS